MPYKDPEKRRKCQRECYARNREKVLVNLRGRRKNLQLIADYSKANKSCKVCGESRPACLLFHHSDPTQKEASICTLISHNVHPDKLIKEIEKCEIVCWNCHYIIHNGRRWKFENGGWVRVNSKSVA